MPAPSNYNDYGILIRVDPTTLYHYADVDIPAQDALIANGVSNIDKTWEGLALGWVGSSATEAQNFNNRWNSAVTKLFGTPEDPSTGALQKIAHAVGLAAVNFGVTEDVVMHMFQSLVDGMGAPPGQPGSPSRNHNDGPVTEVTPPL